MYFSNTKGYPTFLADMLIQQYNEYSKGDADFSITEVIGSPLKRSLEIRHKHEITIDVDRLFFMFIGTLGHAIAEKAKMQYIIKQEHRIFAKHDGVVVSGQLDVMYKHQNKIRIDDFKICSKSAGNEPVKRPYVRQANMYRFLHHKESNQLVDELGILALYRNATMFEHKMDRLPIKCFTLEQCEEFLSQQIALHKLAESDLVAKIPPCVPDDRWAKAESWAIKKNRNKSTRALPKTVVSTKAEALNLLDSKVAKYPDAFIEYRPAVDTFCDECCDVRQFCYYAQDKDEGWEWKFYDLPEGAVPHRVKIGGAE